MLRLRSTNSDQPNVPIRVDRMGIGRGIGEQDGIDTQTLESLVIMTDEIAAFERDALGLGPTEMPAPPQSMVKVAPRRLASSLSEHSWIPHSWIRGFAGLAAAVAIAAGLWQYFKAPVAPVSPLAAPIASTSTPGRESVPSIAHLLEQIRATEAMKWADPTTRSRIYANGDTPLRVVPIRDDALDSEDRSLILAVFQDDDSPWCECVRVQTGTLCSGQRVDQVSKEDLITAAMDSSCMIGADRVSIFAFTGPASKLPATREEAEALAITLAELPMECLKSDPCVQHVASACLPSGVAMVSQTVAINDVRAGW